MTLSARQQAIVSGLLEARRSGQPWQPAAYDASLELDDAYAIQAGVAQALGWFPEGPRAWKVGGTSLVTAAPLPEVLSSPAHWLAAAQPEWLIEAELAFRLARTPAGPSDLLACLGTVCVSIELIGTRLAGGLQAPTAWKIADQSVHAGLVIGPSGLMPSSPATARPTGPGWPAGSRSMARPGSRGRAAIRAAIRWRPCPGCWTMRRPMARDCARAIS